MTVVEIGDEILIVTKVVHVCEYTKICEYYTLKGELLVI